MPDRRGRRACGSRCPSLTTPSETVLDLDSAHRIIPPRQVLHVILLPSNPTSFRNWMPRSLSLKRQVRNSLFASPSSLSKARPYDILRTYGISTRRRWYVEITDLISSPIFNETHTMHHNTAKHYSIDDLCYSTT